LPPGGARRCATLWRIQIKPDFLFVGAAKCGSTWFFKALEAHPQVFVPRAKDIYYFDQHYDRGMAWYESFFEGSGDFAAIGEVSHNYLYSEDALNRIDQDLPGVKLIACLRDPIARAFSAYLFMCRNGTAGANLRDTLEANPKIMQRGLYADYIKRCFEQFGRDRVKVFLFDELNADPVEMAKDLYAFVGVDAAFVHKDANKKVLPASQARFQWLATSAKKGARVVRKLGYPGLVGRLKAAKVTRLLYKPINNDQQTISGEDRRWLFDYFESDVRAVEETLGVDLGNWLREQ
jgi:hypothetical protein